MAESEEVAEVQTIAETLNVADAQEVMSWFEKAVQVTVKYEKELDPKARRFLIMNMEETWGATPARAPSIDASEDDLRNLLTYFRWVMRHIMFLIHPDNDEYDAWISHAEQTMNDCREFLGLPALKLPR
ncbi:MAG TPA: hypothetical protein VFH06_00220 [Candidatus Saccharimonadales bacterium]|nr:hypothetical protein [Candidatus Saccharimonadales bacterium]